MNEIKKEKQIKNLVRKISSGKNKEIFFIKPLPNEDSCFKSGNSINKNKQNKNKKIK